MKQINHDKSYGCIQVAGVGGQLFITGSLLPSASEADENLFFSDMARILVDAGAVPVHERIFGAVQASSRITVSRATAYAAVGISPDLPFTFIQGKKVPGMGLLGCLLHGVIPDGGLSSPSLVMDDGVPVGRRWHANGSEYMMLQGMGATGDVKQAPTDQAADIFKRADRIIKRTGFLFSDVVRTWFYLKGILDWYDAFNRVRSHAYSGFGIMPAPGNNLLLPASTGIEGVGINGSAVMSDIFLVRSFPGDAPERLLNPAQKEAFRYGSAFSRAVRIKEDGASLVEISGTAAIDEAGVSLYPGDPAAQVSCTFDKLETLLGGVQGTLGNIVSATAFVKHPAVAEAFEAVKKSRGLDHFPAVTVQADVCRDELLFEIDAEALVE